MRPGHEVHLRLKRPEHDPQHNARVLLSETHHFAALFLVVFRRPGRVGGFRGVRVQLALFSSPGVAVQPRVQTGFWGFSS